MSSVLIGLVIAAVVVLLFAAIRGASSWRRKRPAAPAQPQTAQAVEAVPAATPKSQEKKNGEKPGFRQRMPLALWLLVTANILFLLFFNELAVVMWERQWLWMFLVQVAVVAWKILTLTRYGDMKWVIYGLVLLGGFFKTTPILLADEGVMAAAVETGEAWKARMAFIASRLGIKQVGSVKIEAPTKPPEAKPPRLPNMFGDSVRQGSQPSAVAVATLAPGETVELSPVALDSTKDWTTLAVAVGPGDHVEAKILSGSPQEITFCTAGNERDDAAWFSMKASDGRWDGDVPVFAGSGQLNIWATDPCNVRVSVTRKN